jgi:hypothetical protein
MKKMRLPQKKTGIWIDQEKAFLIRLEGDKEPVIKRIKSDVESRVRIKGEEKVSARFGNAFIDDQEKKQSRQRNERKRYFDEIIGKVRDDDYIFLFGPGKGKEELKNAIEKEHSMRAKVLAFETTDRLTKNQLLEKTRKYFDSDEFRDALSNMRRKLKVTIL